MDTNELLTPTEAAARLRIGRTLLYKLLASGALPTVTLGARIRIPAAALDAWIAAQTSGGRTSLPRG